MLQKFLAVLERNGTHYSSLNKLRFKTITIFNAIFITVMLFVIVMRLLNGQTTVAIVNSVALSLIATSLFLGFRANLNASILISCFVSTVLSFVLAYSKLLEAVHIIPQFTLLLAFFIIILKTKISRYIYIACCLVLLLFIFLNLNYSITASLPFIVQISGFSIGFNYFVNHLEKQDASLNLAILKLNASNKKKNKLNKSLINKNDELKTFGHIVSHDLKSPLNNIISFSSILSKNASFTNDQHKKSLLYIDQSAIKMKTLIEELLVYHKVEHEDIEFEEVAINEVLNTTLSNFYLDEKESNFKFVVDDLPHIKSNKFLLQILFNNLVSNAIKYQQPAVKITF